MALVAIGGIIKAFAAELGSQSSSGGSSYHGGSFASSGTTTTGGFVSDDSEETTDNKKTKVVNYYHFEGGVYDEKGLARIASQAINKHAGRSAPKLTRKALEIL